jgi:hypothetical protein
VFIFIANSIGEPFHGDHCACAGFSSATFESIPAPSFG